MSLDYKAIGERIRRCRKSKGLTQAQVAELSNISDRYLSNIERAVSIPSTEVIMRLAAALETTPDTFLVGTARQEDEEWRNVAELLRLMNDRKLSLAKSFLTWLNDAELD